MEISSEDSQTYNLWKSMIEDKHHATKKKALHVVQDPISSDELLGEGLSTSRFLGTVACRVVFTLAQSILI